MWGVLGATTSSQRSRNICYFGTNNRNYPNNGKTLQIQLWWAFVFHTVNIVTVWIYIRIQFWQMSKLLWIFISSDTWCRLTRWHAQGSHLMMMEHKQNYRFISWRSLRPVMIHFPPLHLIKPLVIDIWIVPVWPRPQKAVNTFFSLLDWSVGNDVINRRVSLCLYKICFNKWEGGLWNLKDPSLVITSPHLLSE